MIPYDFTQKAKREIKKLSKEDQKRIFEKLEFYLKSPNPLDFAKFIGRRKGIPIYRFRIGGWRVIFDWEEGKRILITKIKPRKTKGLYRF